MISFSFFPILELCKNFDVQLVNLGITIKKFLTRIIKELKMLQTHHHHKIQKKCHGIELLEYPYPLEIHLDSAGPGSLSTCK